MSRMNLARYVGQLNVHYCVLFSNRVRVRIRNYNTA